MILTVTLNTALDVTYDVDELRPDASHRVRAVRERAGGKGINVARVLHAMGREVLCTGLLGGPTGARIAADLATADLPSAMSPIDGESRRTVSVVSAATGGSTLLNEPGPHVTDEEWQRFLVHFRSLAARARVVVCSGSLPPGVPETAYDLLVRIARDEDARTIVDADGMPLARSLEAGPDIVKPNGAELVASTGLADEARAMRWMQGAGAGAVVATFGPEGIRALTVDGAWTARLDRPIAGVNPTGAGDAVAAALAAGLEDGRDWPSMLRDAVTWSAAAVTAPLAGDLDALTLDRVRSSVRVEAA
ncbi:MAG: hexose kinase [Chloroflexi bacterium]|nr:hexose kinase [Chloroflexota bacterium]